MEDKNRQLNSQSTPQDICKIMMKCDDIDLILIQKAYDFAKEAHKEHKRLSGEPYLNHLVGTAINLAHIKADAKTIAAGLLHDTLEDTQTKEEDIQTNFGDEILFLIKGVTKLGKIKYQGAERHAESLRKLFMATAKDIGVILIKLADRLNNIETLESLYKIRPEKAKRIALETLEIYAPIANRLGMGQMKGALEDGSFPYVYPNEYNQTMELRQSKSKKLLEDLEKLNRALIKNLVKAGITKFRTDFRIKHIYSLFQKLQRYNMNIDQIYDISALRVIVPKAEDCYQILGIIHNIWKPLPERLKDYIAMPKPNGYQSIHTVVFTGEGTIAEIQIRSEEMHEEAEFGITSHLFYDEAGKPKTGGKLTKQMKWIKQLIEWQKTVHESKDFLDNLKTDFFNNQIFVYTPKGDVIELPEESSAVDFAYAIHSDVGDHMFGAKINGKFSSFDTPLKNGDIVEIQTKESAHPTYKWLESAKTTEATKRIRIALGGKKK